MENQYTTYAGFKIIKAQPMRAEEALKAGHKTNGREGEEPGYEVEYEDGYKSWSPADVFDAAYTQIGRGSEEIHPSIMGVLKFFEFGHLPKHLQAISAPFSALAWRTARNHNQANGAECTVALRKLLEAKDAAVRAALP